METFYFIECHAARHRIYIPRPTLVMRGPNPWAIVRIGKRAVFLCTDCGCVSSYSDEEIHRATAPVTDPFRRGTFVLHCLEPECDGKNCIAPRRIHVVWDTSNGFAPSASTAQLVDWKNDGTACCDLLHLLSWAGIHTLAPCKSPF